MVNWTLRNKLQWNFNENTKLFIQENASENIICEKVVILSKGRWVKMGNQNTYIHNTYSSTHCPIDHSYFLIILRSYIRLGNFRSSRYKKTISLVIPDVRPLMTIAPDHSTSVISMQYLYQLYVQWIIGKDTDTLLSGPEGTIKGPIFALEGQGCTAYPIKYAHSSVGPYFIEPIYSISTHWGQSKMVAILQRAFSNACSGMEFIFWFWFYWSLFFRVQLTINYHWFR